MTATAINWLPDQPDAYTRPTAVALQSALHQQMIDKFKDGASAAAFLESDRTHWRRMVIVKSQLIMGQNFVGTVLEIGAGTGWCSALLSTAPRVERVYCMDYDPVSVDLLMPQTHKVLGADTSKIQRVHGSFNTIPLQGEVDLVVSIGALHHSENLHATLAECFKCLKPGGWLIAAEPTYPDTETNQQLQARYKKEDPQSLKKYGRVTRHEDNSDHYYRFSEFVVASYSAKFDVYPFIFDLTGSRQADDRVLSERKTATGFFPNVLYPYFAKNPVNPIYDSLLLALRKPESGGVDLGHVLSSTGQKW